MGRTLTIDPEFQNLIPPLSAEEREQLEVNIDTDGIREPLIGWEETGLLLDGHNRKAIADDNGYEYAVTWLSFPDRDAAKAWIIRNQFGRRNLSAMQRAELALKLKPLIEKKAKANSAANLKQGEKFACSCGELFDVKVWHCPRCNHHWLMNDEECRNCHKEKRPDRLNSDGRAEAGRTDDELAKVAGVGKDTIRNVEKIVTKGAEPVKAMAREGKVSIHAAAKVAGLSESTQRAAAAKGPQGVKAAAAFADKPVDSDTTDDGKPKVRGVGLDRAYEAINILKKIPRNDGLRREAIERVILWCKHSSGKGTK